MNSRDYWAQREEEALKHYITDEAEYDRQIRAIYQDMLDNCQKEIESFYAKYASAEGITIADAKKRVAQHDVKAFERKAARYVRDRDFSKQANEELRLYNATMRINRLEMLKANIGLELIAGHSELENFMGGILKGRTMDELQRQAGILGKTVKNNAAKAHAIVNGSFHSGTFSDRIWQYQDIMRQDLGRLLQQGLIGGKNARAITKDLRKYLIGDKNGKGATYNVERLMRTELARVQTEAQKQSFIRNGFDMYEFICNHHASKHGTCEICQGLNGKHFKVADMMPGENAPPIHPHCRCSTAAWEDSKEYEAWLDHLANGGTTEEWEKAKKSSERLENSKKRDYNNDRLDGMGSLGLRFMSNRDRMFQNLNEVPPLRGYEDIACHADPYAFGFVDPVTDETVQDASAKTFARLVRDSGRYKGGAIRLLACESGMLDDGLAQQFANEMGVEVLAPTKKVYTNSQGYVVLADDDEEAALLLRAAKEKWNEEGWRHFEPKGE